MNKCLELWLVLTVAASAVVATVEKDGEILVLTQSNFEEALKENPYLMVEFYAPWCGHCKTLAPEYATAAVRLVDTPFKLAKVDGTVEKQLGTSHEVQGFPTLFYYQNSERKKYTGNHAQFLVADESHELHLLYALCTYRGTYGQGYYQVAEDQWRG